jgi:hypothetical protein
VRSKEISAMNLKRRRRRKSLDLGLGRATRKGERPVGKQEFSFGSDIDAQRLKEEFWKQVVAFEEATPVALFDILSQGGLSLPSPEELDDAHLTAKLWELINGLALLGVYLHNTDHLSDRELYAYLWNEALREETVIFPDDPDFACHYDLVGSGSEEDMLLYLKYYADTEERRRWAQEWPEDVMPAQELPPCDRDRYLPTRERLSRVEPDKVS